MKKNKAEGVDGIKAEVSQELVKEEELKINNSSNK